MRKWVLVIAVGVMTAGLGAFLAVQGLDKADKFSSVFGLFVGVAGLGLAISGAVGVRRQASGQSVTGSSIGGSVTQVRGVRGDVRVGPSIPAGGPPPAPAASAAALAADGGQGEEAGQSVTRSWTAGPVRQVDDVGGDVEVDR